MANVDYILSTSVMDADKEVAATPLYGFTSDATTLAQVVTDAQAVQGLIDPILDGQIVKSVFNLIVPLAGGIKATPVAGSEIERTGLFNWTVNGSIYDYAIDLAAFAAAKFIGNAIDTGDADVSAFIDAIIAGMTHLAFTDKYGNDVEANRNARKTFRKHRKSTSRT